MSPSKVMTDRECMRKKLLGVDTAKKSGCKCLNSEMGFVVKRHEITDRLVQGNMRQWDKQ